MNHLNELIDLTQQLVSVLDDTERGIISTSIHPAGGRVEHFCNPEFFLNYFTTFDVQKRSACGDYPVEIRTEIEGVQFIAILSQNELQLIEEHLPQDWLEPVQTQTEVIHVNFGQIKNPLALACE
ncbi:hypothetical protein OXB_3011 [Bacillus sp. OxB-1]|uniref:hypothetical protein n=1 Tax=Bacillus sp. (strain OxB-1) TaxID=98228 RepID=UPI000581F5EB|nr:hypothetical protein [Bacillus sp. OxB-1]BAQ11481.1 hypothetical protein OXB_3011 [Bacillus sp. OxB-1]